LKVAPFFVFPHKIMV